MVIDTTKQRWCWALYEGPRNTGSTVWLAPEMIGIVLDEQLAQAFTLQGTPDFPRRYRRIPLLSEGEV